MNETYEEFRWISPKFGNIDVYIEIIAGHMGLNKEIKHEVFLKNGSMYINEAGKIDEALLVPHNFIPELYTKMAPLERKRKVRK